MKGLVREMLGALPSKAWQPLFTASTLAALHRTADAMAPVPRIGFEMHLGGARVDHHQQFLAEDRSILLEHARAMAAHSPAAADPWNAIATFADLWLHDPHLLILRDVWLELDAGDGAVMPSSFIGFSSRAPHDARVEVVRRLCAALGNGPPSACLVAAMEAMRANGQLTHIGFMRGRADHGVRLVLLLPSAIAAEDYLATVGWPGSLQRGSAVLNELFDAAEECRIMIDVDERIRPALGIEALVPFAQDSHPGWERLTERLMRMGLCTVDEAAAMTGWPGVDSPGTTDGAWPVSMILHDLAGDGPPCVLARRFSHVKVNLSRDGALSAKAYFGYGMIESGAPASA